MNRPFPHILGLALAGALFHGVASGQSAPTAGSPASQGTVGSSASGAGPGLAREVNDQLPDWLRFGGEYRLRWEDRDNSGGASAADDGYVLSRLRLDLTIKLGSHWRVFFQGQDSQAGAYTPDPDPTTVENDFDLRQGYVEYRQAEKHGWAVRAGRQELSYGDQRIVGAFNWSNTARSFDALKVTYADARVAVDAFASSVVAVNDGAFDRRVDGNNFYGTHATFHKAVPAAELSAYAFWKTSPVVADERGRAGDADTVTFGSRLAGRIVPRADYAMEAIGQRGSYSGDAIRALAAHGRVGYATSSSPAAPRLRAEYNFASGDRKPADGVGGTYDQLYPTNHDKYGIVDQVGYRNLHNVRFGVIQRPNAKVSVEVDYNTFWLAHRRDGLYNAAGALVARQSAGAADAHVAHEADLQVNYTPREGVVVGAGYGHWFPGSFWKVATPGAAQDFVSTQLTYRF